jgi:thioesterase domain-containing protein
LANELAEVHAVFGVQSPGIFGRLLSPTIEGISAHYIAAVREVQPRGPYRIGGYCIGAIIAYEMAAQLLAAGEAVSPLVVLSGTPFPKNAVLNTNEQLALCAEQEANSHGLDLGLDWASLRQQPFEEAWRTVYGACRARGLVMDGEEEHLKRLWSVYSGHVAAALKYDVPPIELDLDVYAASDGEEEYWRPFCRGQLRATRVDGDHLTLLNAPHVAGLAAKLRNRLSAE